MVSHNGVEIMDGLALGRTVTRMAHEVLEKNKGTSNLAIIGIQRRGAVIAQRIADKIKQIDGVDVPVGVLDITLYRDDLSSLAIQPIINKTQIAFGVGGKRIVLVDDVLYTGRTTRAAIDAIINLGRPLQIQLAILIDRGHRELPIRADYVGKNVPTAKDEVVHVLVDEVDGMEGAVITTKAAN